MMDESKEYGKMRRQSGKASRDKGGWKKGGDVNWGLASLIEGDTFSPPRRLCIRCKTVIPMDANPKLCDKCKETAEADRAKTLATRKLVVS